MAKVLLGSPKRRGTMGTRVTKVACSGTLIWGNVKENRLRARTTRARPSLD